MSELSELSENKTDFLSIMSENKTDFLSIMSENKTDFLGNAGPWILFFGTCILLSSNSLFLKIYIFGFFLNFIVNRFFKQYIFNKYKKPQNTGKNTTPSGHAQSVFYSISFLSFIYFTSSTKSIFWKLWICISILIGLNTSYNCIKGGYHTIDQVEIGILFGIAMGYIIQKLFIH